MVYEFQLTDEEFRRAWLAEYFRRPGAALLRVVVGMGCIALGARMAVDAADAFTRGLGGATVVLGMWHLLRPLVMVRAILRQRRASGAATQTMRVSVDESGIAVSDGKKKTELGWDAISAAGSGRGYVWFEVRKASRGTIPLRVVPDAVALRREFESRGKWRG